ncbi:hypothetical protein ACFU53_45895 [Streptomyces sp. NPDC057474]|uniref:hypothetical protein n=1 Tax=Streptomyces sp. NPDC057474 TaxID=3346144 RepID=UPI003689DDC4
MRKGRPEFVVGVRESLLIGCAVLPVAGAIGVTVVICVARSPPGRVYARRLVGPLAVLGVIALEVGACRLMAEAPRGEIVPPSSLPCVGYGACASATG